MDCIFCDIIKKRSKAEIIFENEKVISFLDIRPVNSGHALVVSKEHFDNFLTISPESLRELIVATQFIAGAVKRAVNAEGFNIVSNNGTVAGQTIFHFHFHIIPRFKNDFHFRFDTKPYNESSLKESGKSIRQVISKYKDIFHG
jgi:histidine triad (HIT) family protein